MENIDKQLSKVNKRIEEGKISREIGRDVLLEGNPTRERMYGRLEAYLQTGVVIDPDDLRSVVEQYEFSVDELKNLTEISHAGMMEGLVQEPDNMNHYGLRTGCFAYLSSKFFEKK